MGAIGNDPATSVSLLMRIKDSSDFESWQRFDAVYAPIIRRYCRRRGFQNSDIEDITQEVMSAVSKAIRKFEYQPERGKFRGWLATVTANKIKDFAAKNSSQRKLLLQCAEQLASDPEPDPQWNEVFLQQVFSVAKQHAQADVHEKTWLCFQRTWVDLIPAAQVATELDLPIHSVYVNKSRVLKKIEKEFLTLSDEAREISCGSELR